MKYSVLLLYPDHACDDYGHETYYAWVEAVSPDHAVRRAKRQAYKANRGIVEDPADFHTLLLLEGHHCGLLISHP